MNRVQSMQTSAEPRTTATPLVVGLIGAAFALIGAMRMPYPYYGVMRVVIVFACVVLGVGALSRRLPIVLVPLAIAAIFFLLVRGLSRDTWAAIDIVTAVGLAALGAWLTRHPVQN